MGGDASHLTLLWRCFKGRTSLLWAWCYRCCLHSVLPRRLLGASSPWTRHRREACRFSRWVLGHRTRSSSQHVATLMLRLWGRRFVVAPRWCGSRASCYEHEVHVLRVYALGSMPRLSEAEGPGVAGGRHTEKAGPIMEEGVPLSRSALFTMSTRAVPAVVPPTGLHVLRRVTPIPLEQSDKYIIPLSYLCC